MHAFEGPENKSVKKRNHSDLIAFRTLFISPISSFIPKRKYRSCLLTDEVGEDDLNVQEHQIE
jgi:hypothetical protein